MALYVLLMVYMGLSLFIIRWAYVYLVVCVLTHVLLRLRVQNRRKKWNFPLNFRTMRKLSELYSRIFQNYWIWMCIWWWLLQKLYKIKKSELLNSRVYYIVEYSRVECKRYISNNSRTFQKISERWVLENLDVHLERTTSELEFKSEK